MRGLIGKDACPVCRAIQHYAKASHERAPDQELSVPFERVDEHVDLQTQFGDDEQSPADGQDQRFAGDSHPSRSLRLRKFPVTQAGGNIHSVGNEDFTVVTRVEIDKFRAGGMRAAVERYELEPEGKSVGRILADGLR